MQVDHEPTWDLHSGSTLHSYLSRMIKNTWVIIQLHRWGTTGKQWRKQGGRGEGGGREQDMVPKGECRGPHSSTTRIGRLDPEAGPCWLAWSPSPVLLLLLLCRVSRSVGSCWPASCPAAPPPAASQRFWETRLQHLVPDNLDTQTHYKSGHLRLGQAIQTRFSLPPCAHETSSSSRTDVPDILMLHCMRVHMLLYCEYVKREP